MNPMIEIRQATRKAQPIFTIIQNFYQQLPETICGCEKSGACCAFLPQMTLMEALQWFRLIQQMPLAERTAVTLKFIEFYLSNPIRHMGCPFLSEGRCGNYEFRTFACRAYGLWSISMGRDRTQQSRAGKRLLIKTWQNLGVEVKPEAITTEMDYCDQVGCKSELIISDDRLMAILRKIYLLDDELPGLKTQFENGYYSDFSFLMASLALGTKKAVLGKFAVIKELTRKGTDQRLINLLCQIRLDAIAPSD